VSLLSVLQIFGLPVSVFRFRDYPHFRVYNLSLRVFNLPFQRESAFQ
jgi:hypothetical protein